jgi:SAM-dependent methyltransferase
MTDQVRDFYGRLAPDYHLIFADWRTSVLRQAEVLDLLLRGYFPGVGPHTVLDCACGIGTQAIGLATRGYRVHATDISAQAIERARQEVQSFEVELTFAVADFLKLEEAVAGSFDAVIAFDNAVAHVQNEVDLERLFRSMASKVAPGGVLAFSLRDYDQLVKSKPRTTTPNVNDHAGGKTIVFQVWDWWDDGTGYRLNHYTVHQRGDTCETLVAVSDLRAWRSAEIGAALDRAGLAYMWHLPADTGFYQPIVTARKCIAWGISPRVYRGDDS